MKKKPNSSSLHIIDHPKYNTKKYNAKKTTLKQYKNYNTKKYNTKNASPKYNTKIYNMKNTARKYTRQRYTTTKITPTLILTIFLQVFFPQWSTDFSPLKNSTQCNNMGILPPIFGSNYSRKPKGSMTSKVVSSKRKWEKLNKSKVSIIQHKRKNQRKSR